jgi:hypothetical protein
MKLSKELDRHKNNIENILTYTKRDGILKIPQYCANAGLPLYVVWYHIQENFDEHREEAQRELRTICKFYNLVIDVDLKGIDSVVETDE